MIHVCAERTSAEWISTKLDSVRDDASFINRAKFHVDQCRGLNFMGSKISSSDRNAKPSLSLHCTLPRMRVIAAIFTHVSSARMHNKYKHMYLDFDVVNISGDTQQRPFGA